MVKPMKKISEELVYNGKRKISKAIFKSQDGKLLEYELRIGHKNTNIFAITKDNKIILVKQFRVGPNTITTDFPGGGVDSNETPMRAAKRELLEETGYKGQLKFLNTTFLDAYSTAVQYNYIAINCIKISEKVADYWEVILVTEEELLKLIKQGDILNSHIALSALLELGKIKLS